jgi:hypothetical protein
MDINTEQMRARISESTHREPVMTPAALRSTPESQVLYLFGSKR